MIKDCFLDEMRIKLKLNNLSEVKIKLEDIILTGKAFRGVTIMEAKKMLFLLHILDSGISPTGSGIDEF